MADFAGTMQTGRRRTCYVLHQEDDKDFDPVRLTTQHNHGWKVDYETEQLVATEVLEEYVKPPFAYYEVIQKNFVEFD